MQQLSCDLSVLFLENEKIDYSMIMENTNFRNGTVKLNEYQ